jgi:hypothetical protein
MKTYFATLIIALASFSLSAQDFQQTIRGVVKDAENKTIIPGAKVLVSDIQSDSAIVSVITDQKGEFLIESIAVGRYRVLVSALSYEAVIMEDVLLSSAKEMVLDVELIPGTKSLEAIEVFGTNMRGEPLNRMAITSAITITPEQTSKYAASWDDPLRVALAYPGVSQQSSGFNDFSVRGNSPLGVLYRLEGIPIHNPNHFASIGSSGGFVTQFSSSVLGNSDFYSGVFPAEFGNATTAAFDFRFRNGNNKEREHAFKTSFFGLDFATEGPLSKNSDASYLVNYRYSTLGLLAQMINIGGLLPVYQDISFNLNLPTKKWGTFKVFGIGGVSSFLLGADKDSANWTEESNRFERVFGSNSATVGVSHIIKSSEKGYWHSGIAASGGRYFDETDYIADDLSYDQREKGEYMDQRLTATVDYNHKFNRRHSNKTGAIFTHVNHDYMNMVYDITIPGLDTLSQTNGSAQYFQLYTQSKFFLSDRLILNVGLHYLHFLLNDNVGIDPRMGLTYELNPRAKFTLGYGHQSRLEDLTFYFIEQDNAEGQPTYVNQDAQLSKSHQAALNYSQMLTKSLRLTAEVYFQYLYNVPADPNGTYSVQNLFYRLPVGNLENIGEGKNYGLELALQQFTRKGLYFLVSGTVFNAQYKAGDGIWRNTEFNQQFAFNLLAGKEFVLKEKADRKRLFALNVSYRHAGGVWINPIDLEASQTIGWTQFDMSNPYSDRQGNQVGLDVSMNFQVLRKKVTSKWSLSIKNLYTSRQVIRQEYDIETNSIKEFTDYGVIPVFGYTLYF